MTIYVGFEDNGLFHNPSLDEMIQNQETKRNDPEDESFYGFFSRWFFGNFE